MKNKTNQKLIVNCMRALSDPVRLEIFEMLKSGRLCACKILERFSISQPTLSYHMKQLVDSGLVDAEKEWKWSYYTLNPETLSYLTEFLSDGIV